MTSAAAQPANAAVVQGALDALTGAGKTAGIYCTWYQWGQITGSYMPPARVPIWVAGATSLGNGYYSALSYCQRALSAGDPSTTCLCGHRVRRRHPLARAVRVHIRPGARR